LRVVDEKNISSGRLSYIVSARTAKNGGVGTMVLKPARIHSDRAEPLYQPDLVFFKFEN